MEKDKCSSNFKQKILFGAGSTTARNGRYDIRPHDNSVPKSNSSLMILTGISHNSLDKSLQVIGVIHLLCLWATNSGQPNNI